MENALIINNYDKYEVMHCGERNDFVVWNSNGLGEILLRNVVKHKEKWSVIYIISSDGYAVAEKDTGICRIYVTVSDEEFINGWTADKDGNRVSISLYKEDEKIIYLNSFEDFTDSEKKVFEKMQR